MQLISSAPSQRLQSASLSPSAQSSCAKTMKILCLISVACLLGCASAGYIGHAVPAVGLEDSPPHYEFHYSVHDSHTGDVKDQFEHRQGDYVTGRYSLIEPDGNRRIVEYNADPLLGFTAQVHREAPSIHQLGHH